MDYDPLKALQEELSGLMSVRESMRRRERIAEEAMGKAESELNDIRKMRGFVDLEVDRKRAVLAALKEASR